MKREHIKVTVELLNDFKKYMHDLYGGTPETLAKRRWIRYDEHQAKRDSSEDKV